MTSQITTTGGLEKVQGWLQDAQAWNMAGSEVVPWLFFVLLLCGVVLVVGPTWYQVRNVVTLFHELGHALAGLFVGGRVKGISLHTDTSGVTNWSFPGDPGRLRRAWVAWWGYPMPALVAGSGILLVESGYGRFWMLGLFALCALTLVAWVRNRWGFLMVLLATLVFLGSVVVGGLLPAHVAALFLGVLTGGAWRTAAEHLKDGRGPEGAQSDSRVVAKEVFVPVVLVRTSFLLMAVVLPVGGYVLGL